MVVACAGSVVRCHTFWAHYSPRMVMLHQPRSPRLDSSLLGFYQFHQRLIKWSHSLPRAPRKAEGLELWRQTGLQQHQRRGIVNSHLVSGQRLPVHHTCRGSGAQLGQSQSDGFGRQVVVDGACLAKFPWSRSFLPEGGLWFD